MISFLKLHLIYSFDPFHFFLDATLQALSFVLNSFHLLNMLIDVFIERFHFLIAVNLFAIKLILTFLKIYHIIYPRVYALRSNLVKV